MSTLFNHNATCLEEVYTDRCFPAYTCKFLCVLALSSLVLTDQGW